MTLLALLACSPDPTLPDAPLDTDTGSPPVEDTAAPLDTATTGHASTECLAAGSWRLQIRGWADKGWTIELRQSNTGCAGTLETDIAGTVEVSDIAVDPGATTWTGTGLYTGVSTWQPQPLVFTRRDDGGWSVDGQLMALASAWELLPAE
jgi:hypothetical protein